MPQYALPLLIGLLLCACGGVPANTADATRTYAAIAHATYEDTAASAAALDAAVEAFTARPTPETLQAARRAWLEARESYLQTEVFRFYGGPIDAVEGLLNAWPLDEAYIDYVEGAPDAGIIQRPDVAITPETLIAMNEQGGEENIATGYHAVEFLLWGQDQRPDGPGDRPHTDYLAGAPGSHERRATYLTTTTGMLSEQLAELAAAWAPGAPYRATFEALSPRQALRHILTGMIILSGFETGGERLQVALDSGSPEDEHSCFSDNTHRDTVQDIQGIQNVYLGAYTRPDGALVQGVGVRDVIAARDPELARALEAQIAESLAAARALQPPFDQEIAPGNTEGRARVQAVITSLRAQEGLLEEALRLFELDAPEAE